LEPTTLLLNAEFIMQVFLSPKDYNAWLETDRENLLEMLRPFPASEMTAVAVNPIVNNARNEVAECIEPFAAK
jgi:putative SOS response-associated peptidase YedK